MKVAMITPVWPPIIGGIGSVAQNNALGLKKIGISVTVFTPDYNRGEISSELEVIKVRPQLKYGNAALLLDLPKKFVTYDIVHLHYPFLGAAEVVLGAKRKARWKLILHYHHDLVGVGWRSIFFKIYNRLFLGKIIKAADKIFVTSLDYAANSDIRIYYQKFKGKFIEVPNGVSAARFFPCPPAENLIKKYNLDNKKILLFVGGLDSAHYFKGVDILINSLAKIFNAKLLIVGEGNLKASYQKLAASLNISDRVIFAGRVLADALPKYYNLADILILPSIDKSEAFGLVLLEAMACGKPVVTSNLPGVRSVVADNETGLLAKAGDSSDLVEKINYLLSNPDICLKLGEAGRQQVLQKYDWPKICQVIYNQYFF